MGTLKILIAPGAFKHSLSASATAEAIARGLERSGLVADLRVLPLADGGNGTLDAFLAAGGQRIPVTVEGPFGAPVEAAFGLLPDGITAVIEMALASGIELVPTADLNPLLASTYGTGQVMQAALNHGARRLIIGLGGSATVDGGAGALQVTGIRLLDAAGQPIPRGGRGLAMLHTVDVSQLDPRWREVEVIIASDVDNPALGEQGAAAVFGPQKGATPDMVVTLDQGLAHFFGVIAAQTGVDVRTQPGGGAAGALAAGLLALLPARIESGIDLLLTHTGFERELAGAALVITGEGRLDSQSVRGKTPAGIARRAQAAGVPVVAIVGGLALEDAALHAAGIQAGLSIITEPMTLEEALRRAPELIERAGLRLGYLLQLPSFA